jgi:hypothetical protein
MPKLAFGRACYHIRCQACRKAKRGTITKEHP